VDYDNQARPNDIPEVDNNNSVGSIDIGCDEYYWTLTAQIIRDTILGRIIISTSFYNEVDFDKNGIIDICDIIRFINYGR
jgi:hypothetical protein